MRYDVLYVFGYGDWVIAFVPTVGTMLWQYQRTLREGTSIASQKTLAPYGDKLLSATPDLDLLALNARTVALAWDVAITDRQGFRNPGGPLVTDGVVMLGLTTQEGGGALIAGFSPQRRSSSAAGCRSSMPRRRMRTGIGACCRRWP